MHGIQFQPTQSLITHHTRRPLLNHHTRHTGIGHVGREDTGERAGDLRGLATGVR